MVKNHLKSIAAPKTWSIKRKENKFIVRQNPGSHKLENSMALSKIFIDMLKLAKTAKEVKQIIYNKTVTVNGKRTKDIRYSVGLFDVISIPDIKANYRMVIDKKGKLNVVSASDAESTFKPQKIIGKKVISKAKVQLNFFDGSNTLVAAKNDYVVGDTVVYDFKEKKITNHFKLEKKTTVFLTAGKQIGQVLSLDEIDGDNIFLKKETSVIETKKRFAYVLGKEKSIIGVGN